MDINILSNKLEIKYYTSVIRYAQKNNLNFEWLNSHLDNLKKTIITTKMTLTETQTEKVEKVEKIEKTEHTENHNQIFNDEDLYKKPWTKLNPIHKILKIKEFVNNQKISSEQERTDLKDQLVLLIKSKVLTKKEKVLYDEKEGKIISLVDLQYKDGKYYYK